MPPDFFCSNCREDQNQSHCYPKLEVGWGRRIAGCLAIAEHVTKWHARGGHCPLVLEKLDGIREARECP